VLLSLSISYDGATLFVGSTDKNIYALNAVDGSLMWKYKDRFAFVTSSPTLSAHDTNLFVGSKDYSVYAVNTIV